MISLFLKTAHVERIYHRGGVGKSGYSMDHRPRIRVLFVCTGNIFRSLTAEYALRDVLGARRDIIVASAGTEDYPYEVRPLVRDYLLTRGFDVSGHRRRTLTQQHAGGGDPGRRDEH